MTGDTRYQDGSKDHDLRDERTPQVGCVEWRHMSSGVNRCEENVGASKVSSLEVKTKT